MFQECEYEISQKGELVAKLENKTRDISQMLNNLNKITATPVKKKKNDAPKADTKDLDSKDPKNQNNGDDIKIVVDEVQESKTE